MYTILITWIRWNLVVPCQPNWKLTSNVNVKQKQYMHYLYCREIIILLSNYDTAWILKLRIWDETSLSFVFLRADSYSHMCTEFDSKFAFHLSIESPIFAQFITRFRK